mgnify:CR=1 FL=1
MSIKATVNDMMVAYAEDAVDFARNNFNLSLDYSDSSIELVESIASQLYDTIPRGIISRLLRSGPSADEIDQVCKMLGGYIGETIRRRCGGQWGFNETVLPSGLVVELTIGEVRIFPPAKVSKRLQNGSEDNLYTYYRVIIQDLLAGAA